ncbi:MAG: J domain-containing protein [Nitrospira sp.]|nr:DnaJ domain-containing protein [Nitrospira sp.]ULA58469.1 MAG: J domain-containing protein [Nitrospira sp.]
MPHHRTTDYYVILELSSDATEADIRRAWHEQMQVWHPDRFVHSPALHRKAEVRTQLINQAYQTLSDPAARARYDRGRHHPSAPPPPPRPSPAAQPQPAARPRQELRGPQTMLNVTRFGHPKIMVPAIHLLVDVHETQPYEFKGLIRIAGTRTQALPAGDYAIAEAPDIFRVERRRAEEFNTIVSNPSDNRPRFLRELERLCAIPHRFLVIEGALHSHRGAGRLGQYHRNGLIDFLDSITARFAIQIVHAESREDAEDRIANLAAIHYAYHLAEQQGLGRCLTENDA